MTEQDRSMITLLAQNTLALAQSTCVNNVAWDHATPWNTVTAQGLRYSCVDKLHVLDRKRLRYSCVDTLRVPDRKRLRYSCVDTLHVLDRKRLRYSCVDKLYVPDRKRLKYSCVDTLRVPNRKRLRLLGSVSSSVSWCDDHERDKSAWSCTSRRRV